MEQQDTVRNTGLADITQTLELWSTSLHTRRSILASVYSLETPRLPAELQDSTLSPLPRNKPEAVSPQVADLALLISLDFMYISAPARQLAPLSLSPLLCSATSGILGDYSL